MTPPVTNDETRNHKMAYPVTFFEVLGQDVDKLGRFYAAAFGWKLAEPSGTGYRLVDTAAGHGIPGGIGKAQNGSGWATFYLSVPDPAATLAGAERLGGKMVMPAKKLPIGVTIGYFSDPEGHIVGLVKE